MKKNYTTTILPLSLLLIGWSNVSTAQTIGAGGWHSLVICTDSTVKTFGENATGELGNGSTTDSNTPVTAIGLSSMVSVSGGGDQLEAHSLALKSNGTVWSWGSNIYGGLGNGTLTSTTTPGQVILLTNAIAASAGGWHSVALKNDGTVWTWGWNIDGQLGDGTTTDKLIPFQVPGLTGITAISAGTYHVLALKNDGTVWAWGDNISGQIGDNSTTDRTTPVQVSGLSGIVKVSAGRFFSLAVKDDGTVWTWGENLYGQLGNGTTTDSHVPVQVSGLTGVTSAIVTTGAFHCIAVKNDNTVWAWGRNTYGNLGDNTTTHRSSPVQMTGVSDVKSLGAGTNFSLIAKTDGTFWGCGRNLSGQLGDGTFLQRNLATQSSIMCPILLPVGINEQEKSVINITTFPNPSFNGFFNLRLNEAVPNSGIETSVIEVYNVIGKKVLQMAVKTQDLNADMIIDLSNQPAGVYFMNLQIGDHSVNSKLIKQ